MCRLILSDLSLHCNRHINNSVRVWILWILTRSVSWLIFSGVRGFVSLRDLLDGPGLLFDSGTESTTNSFTACLPCDRRAAPLPCKFPGGCQHLVVVPHVCLDACLLEHACLKACRLSGGRLSWYKLWATPRPSLSGTGVPWVSCLDPPVCHSVQDVPEVKSQPVVVLG